MDGLAGLIVLFGDGAVQDGFDDLVDGLEHSSFLAEAWRCDHPDLLMVLTALGNLHRDAKTRKAAKKALFKARTRSVNAPARSAGA